MAVWDIQPLKVIPHLKTLLGIKTITSAKPTCTRGGIRTFFYSLNCSSAVTLSQQLKKKGNCQTLQKLKTEKKAATSLSFGDRTISLSCQRRTEKPPGRLWEKPAGERPNYCHCCPVELRDGCPGRSCRHASRPEGLVPLLQKLSCT